MIYWLVARLAEATRAIQLTVIEYCQRNSPCALMSGARNYVFLSDFTHNLIK